MFWENFLANLLSSIIAGIALWIIGVNVYKAEIKKIKTHIITNINVQNKTGSKSEINYNQVNVEKFEQNIKEQYNIEKTGRSATDEDNKNLINKLNKIV